MDQRTHSIRDVSEPFFIPGNRTGCLLIHGFTNSPQVMRGMGNHLAGLGYSVLAIRMPGHGTTPQDLNRTRLADWLGAAADGYHILRGVADQIFVIAHSVGGAVGLLLTLEFEIAGAVGIAIPHHQPPHKKTQLLEKLPWDYRMRALTALSWVMPLISKGGPSMFFDDEAGKIYQSYRSWPVRAVVETRLLFHELRERAPKITTPVQLIYSKNDAFVPPLHMEAIFEKLGSEDKTKLLVEKSGHILTMDAEKERVFASVEAFIDRLKMK